MKCTSQGHETPAEEPGISAVSTSSRALSNWFRIRFSYVRTAYTAAHANAKEIRGRDRHWTPASHSANTTQIRQGSRTLLGRGPHSVMEQERNVMQRRNKDLEGTEGKDFYQSSRTGDRPTDVEASNIWLPLQKKYEGILRLYNSYTACSR
jgi:hypothetical protein